MSVFPIFDTIKNNICIGPCMLYLNNTLYTATIAATVVNRFKNTRYNLGGGQF